MTKPDNSQAAKPSGERIAKLLARAGIASRREVERMIADRRIKLNGVLIDTPATILPNLKGITVDDRPVAAAEPTRLFLFHKPAGLLTAERDPAGRPTIYAALRNALPPGTPRMMPVGRLDLNTEGLLLLTNDGALKRAMELPASGIPRIYRARTFGGVTQGQLEELIEGITIDGMHYGKIDANLERGSGRNQWIEVKLTEGKNREVRRVLEHLGLEVSRLLRTAYGPFELRDLPRGQAVEVRQVEVERFCKALRTGQTYVSPNPAPLGSKPPRKAAIPDNVMRTERNNAGRSAPAIQEHGSRNTAESRPSFKGGKRAGTPRKPRPSEKLIDRPKRPPTRSGPSR